MHFKHPLLPSLLFHAFASTNKMFFPYNILQLKLICSKSKIKPRLADLIYLRNKCPSQQQMKPASQILAIQEKKNKNKTVHLCCLTQILILGYFIWKESEPSYLTLRSQDKKEKIQKKCKQKTVISISFYLFKIMYEQPSKTKSINVILCISFF